MKTFKKLKKGFTLVELVVVIAVIAILAAVSVGAYFGVTESANNSKLEQEAKQVYTAIQTVALAPNDHSNLSKSGLEIKDAAEFEKALEGNLGFDVALTDELKKDPSRPTVYFSDAAYSSAFSDKVYKTFTYLLPEIANKGAVADIVTGECRATESSAVEEELGDNDKEHSTASVVIADYADANNWENSKAYFNVEIDEKINVSAIGAGNTAKYYTSGEEWRFYQHDNSEFIIGGDYNVIISSVTINYAIEKTGILLYGNSQVKSGDLVTINSREATFSVGNTGEVTNGQVKVREISVNYYIDLTAVEPEIPTTPEEPTTPIVEPEVVSKTIEQLKTEVVAGNSFAYYTEGYIVSWYSSKTYGNFYLASSLENSETSNTTILVYGSTEDSSRLTYDGEYNYSSVDDFNVDSYNIGDFVKMKVIVKTYNESNQLSGIITEVEHLSCPLSLVITYKDNSSTYNIGGSDITHQIQGVEVNDEVTAVVKKGETTVYTFETFTADKAGKWLLTYNFSKKTISGELLEGVVEDGILTSTLTFKDTVARKELDSSKQIWSNETITLVNEKAESTNSVADYSNPVRFYKSSTVSIQFPSNNIKQIKIESEENGSGDNTYFNNLKNSLSNVTYTEDGTNLIIENYTSNELNFTCASGQVRLFAISIQYSQSSSEPITPPVIEKYTLTINTTPVDCNIVLATDKTTVNGSSIEVEENTDVTYTVSKAGYISQSGTIKVTKDEILSIELVKEDTGADSKQENDVEIQIKGTTGVKTPDGESISWSNENVTLRNDKADSTTAIRTSDSDHYRVYAKSKLYVSVANNQGKLTKVVFTCSSSSYATALKTSLEGNNLNVAESGTIITVTCNSVEEISCTITVQTRITKVLVTYEY